MRRLRDDERGASAVLVSVLMGFVLLVSAAFAVDLGQQRVVRGDMQAVADVVALDLSRQLTGKPASTYDKAAMDAEVRRSVARNEKALGGPLGNEDVTWEFVRTDGSGAWVTVPKTATDQTPTAVRVSARSDVKLVFGGITGVDRGGAVRTAIARSQESACFRIGSFIASLDSRQSALLNPLLNALMGSSLNLDAVSYKGLAAADVSLLDLVNVGGLGVGTVEELLELDDVSLASLFLAAATVLDQQGKLAEANILRAIQVAAGTPTIALGQLINAAPGDTAALGATINVLDLITGAALVANDDHAVAVPNLGISLPGVASVTTTLHVIEAPRTGCTGRQASTSQIRLDLAARINGQSLGVPALNTSVTLAPIDLAISIDLGKAVAELTKVTCNPSGPDSLTVALRSAVVGGLSISAKAGVKATIDPIGGLLTNILSLLNLGSLLKPPYLTLDTSLDIFAGTGTATGYDKTVTVPLPGGYTTPSGSGTGLLIGPVQVTPKVNTNLVLHYWEGLLLVGSWKERNITDPLNAVFSGVLNPLISTLLSSVLNPLVATLQTALVNPLAQLLGLQLGGADVYALRTPTCSGPRLVG